MASAPEIGSSSPSKISRAKLKKLARKQDIAQQKEDSSFLKAASDVEDHVASFEPFRKFNRSGLTCTLKYYHTDTLPKELREFTFGLVKSNMQSLYENCEMIGGWSDRGKKEEMFDTTTRFIVAFEEPPADASSSSVSTPKPVGFASFRFDMDYGRRVIYLYELQVIAEARSKGLGKHLMVLLDLIGRKAQLELIVLTVFTENPSSCRFFREKLKYVVDPTNPNPAEVGCEVGFEILSKPLSQPKASSSTSVAVVPK